MVRTQEDDPRYRRTRRLLVGAVMELAADRPAAQISVSELAGRAGVSRSAFYAHASSPSELLADHLVSRLDPFLERLGGVLEEDPEDYLLRWRAIYVELLEAVREDRLVYAHIFDSDDSGVVLARLRARLREAAEVFVAHVVDHLEEPPTPLWQRMAVAQHVSNTVVVLDSWLADGASEEPETVVDTFISLAPPWLLIRLDADGRATLGRSRLLARLAAWRDGAEQDQADGAARPEPRVSGPRGAGAASLDDPGADAVPARA